VILTITTTSQMPNELSQEMLAIRQSCGCLLPYFTAYVHSLSFSTTVPWSTG